VSAVGSTGTGNPGTSGPETSPLEWTDLDRRAVDTVRVLAADAVQKAGSGHPGTAMSLAPAAYLLFQRVMRHDPADPHWLGRDRFVLSAGHTSLTLYLQLFLSGYGLTVEDIAALRTWGSKTPGHPEYQHTDGVEITTGPLGQGLASAVGMDKEMMKLVFAGQGLPVGPFRVVRPGELDRDPPGVLARVQELGLPVFVKPARAGSSLGISKVTSWDGLAAAIRVAAEHDPKVLVEAAVEGREIECGVLGGRGGAPARASLPGEIVVHGEHAFYDFEAKYLDEASVDLTCPADLPDEVTAGVRELAVRAFDAIGCEGLARVDVFVRPDGDVVLNEINTMPGFTPFSMYPRMWASTGLDYPALVDELIQLALERPTGLR